MRRLSATEKYLTSRDGLKLYYEVAGDGKHTLFFLHGMGGDVAAWDEIRTFFIHLGYTTIALDLRGHGYSAHPNSDEGFQFERMAEDVRLVVEAEKCQRFTMIGHCYGGIVACFYASRFSATLSHLILLTVSYKTPYISRGSISGMVADGLLKALTPFVPAKVHPRHSDYSSGKFEKDFEPVGLFNVLKNNSPKSYLRIMRTMTELDMRTVVQSINVPTLLISGAEDSIYSVDALKAMQSAISGSSLVIVPHANHPVVLNNPMEVATRIQQTLIK